MRIPSQSFSQTANTSIIGKGASNITKVEARSNPPYLRLSKLNRDNSDSIKAKITRKFISEKHYAAITDASKRGNFSVSFRAAGVHTIKAISLSGPMKGHDILEKTITKSSLKKAYPDDFNTKFESLKTAGLLGLVGHWDNDGLQGVWCINSDGSKEVQSIYDRNGMFKKHTDFLDEDGRLTAFTGDYDMHDMITHRSGRPRTVLSDSREEKEIINSINNAISKVDNARPFRDVEYNPVRHGPQVNFVSHMLNMEMTKVKNDNGVLRQVAEPGDFPIAMVSKGEWTMISDINDLQAFYTKKGAVMKQSWQVNGVRCYQGKGPYVKLARRTRNTHME